MDSTTRTRSVEPEIVVGVDGTATALGAVAWAAVEARLTGRPLRILHAAPYATPAGRIGRQRAEAILAHAYTVAHRREPDVTVHTTLVDDQPVPALVATSVEAGLLVVGMAGGALGDVVVGSVAVAVSGRASCPVTVVRGRSDAAELPVLVGVLDVDADADAISAAFDAAQRHHSSLVVLHVHHLTGEQPERTDLDAQLAPWRIRHPDVPVEVRTVHGRPDEQILRAASDARLVVVSTRGRGPVVRALVGSCGRMLVKHSPCPVCIVPRTPALTRTVAAPAAGTDPHDRSQLW